MKKRIVKIALVLLIAGVALCVAGLAFAGFDPQNLQTGGAFAAREYAAGADVTELLVRDFNTEIIAAPSSDGTLRLTCYENEYYTYAIEETDGILRVEKRDARPWYQRIFSWPQPVALTLEIPRGLSLDLATANAAITLREIAASDALLESSNGALTLEDCALASLNAGNSNAPMLLSGGSVRGEVVLEGDNGRIRVENLTAATLSAATENAEIALSDVRADSVALKGDNGPLTLESVVAGELRAETSNAPIRFSALSVSQSISLRNDNGAVRGALPGLMGDYTVESGTSNADNSLPASARGGAVRLEVYTSNEDIDIDFVG